MAWLERWKPSRELDRFQREFDDLFERFGFEPKSYGDWEETNAGVSNAQVPGSGFEHKFLGDWESAPSRPALESCVEGDKFVVRTDLPGIDPKDVDIKVVGDMLTIKGKREEKSATKKTDYYRREVRYGSFERAVTVPEGIKAEHLKATYHDGVLELTAPMPQEAAPKEVKIPVEAQGPKKVEAETKAAV